MAERSEEPHHQVFRRVGDVIIKQLNLSDEALVSRLIAKGCISEKTRAKYTGQTKMVRQRFVGRLQNQPYKVFLAFVECLKEDAKYSELVTTVEAIMAEYNSTPAPSTADIASATTPSIETDKNELLGPSLMTAGCYIFCFRRLYNLNHQH